MELSESVQRGLQSLADHSAFDHSSFQVLVDVSFRSLLSSHGDPAVLGELLPLYAALLLSLRLLPVSLRVRVCGGAASIFADFYGSAARCERARWIPAFILRSLMRPSG